jgi:formylglycine-generating enzyme required for sulfatase activity
MRHHPIFVHLIVIALLLGLACEDDESGSGNSAPEIQTVAANPASVPVGGSTQLTCTALDDDQDELDYTWSCPDGSFPDGVTARSVSWQAPSATGSYAISVSVNDGSAEDHDFVTVSVTSAPSNTAPSAGFTVTPSSGTPETTFQVDASGSSDNESSNSQLNYRWDWTNDGTWDEEHTGQMTESHQYASSGSYTIKLKVEDPQGLTDETTRTVSVGVSNTPPTASFTISPEIGNVGTTITFNASGSTDAQTPDNLQYKWDYTGDGTWNTSYSSNPVFQHAYTETGDYNVGLMVSDPDGLTDTYHDYVHVTNANTPPTAVLSVDPTSGDTTTGFRFDASESSDAQTQTLEARWDFDDDGSWEEDWSENMVFIKYYEAPGSYTCRVEVRDEDERTDEATVEVEVADGNTPPVAAFTISPESGYIWTDFSFDASGSSDNESEIVVRWDWEDDGVFDTGWQVDRTETHTFGVVGTFDVVLEVLDQGGLSSETTHSVIVSEGGGEVAPPTMITIPHGDFMMGQAGVESPEHEVTLTRDFELSQTEITNAQYMAALQWAYDNGYVTASSSTVEAHGQELLDLDDSYCEISFSGGIFSLDQVVQGNYGGESSADHPVKEVSWYGAACYCDWLSLMNSLPAYYNGQWNQTPNPNDPYDASGYRLPTEAEWEFAAQYDDERTYPWGNSTPTSCVHANYSSCVGWTAPVGSYPAGDSELGLHDMAGNVYEWCNDWYADYSAGSVADPPGPNSGSNRVIRGGGWYSSAAYLRCAYRYSDPPSYAYSNVGFRLCRTAD